MATKVKVTIADENGCVLNQVEVDIEELDRDIRSTFESRGEAMAARRLNSAGDEVQDALSHEIKRAWKAYCAHTGRSTVM